MSAAAATPITAVRNNASITKAGSAVKAPLSAFDATAVVPSEARPVLAATRGPGHSPAKEPNALNVEQLKIILEVVADKARTLQQMLMLLKRAQIEDEYAQDVCLDAATDLATTIGAMVDEASGGRIIGNAADWYYGTDFDGAGKAVQS